VEIARRQLGENTRAVHLPPPPDTTQRPLGTPVYRTAAWAFSSAQEYAAVLNDQMPGYSYSRIDNPTVDAFARAVAALEGAHLQRWPAAQAFASGMAAISGVFWTFARAGAHVVASAAVYGGTYSLLRNVLTRFGVEIDFVDITDVDAVAAAVRPTTRIIYAETIANPTTAVADIGRLAEIAHEHGALLVVDSTLAPPVICRPLEHGADLVVHSATKYIGGHSDVTGGVVTGALELITQIRATRVDTGGSLSPDDAFLLRRGLETLPVRVRRQCATASVFAATLAKHPAVAYVDYPGLPTHPGHEIARRLFDSGPEGVRFGAVVTVTPYGGREAGLAFASSLRLAAAATSLGGTHTVVSHVASTTHRQLDERALAAAGIDAGAVRFSIGLEDSEDLISDAFVALEALAAGTRGYPHGDVTPRQLLFRWSAATIFGLTSSSGGGAWVRRARSGSPWSSAGAARSTRCRVRARGWCSGPSTVTATTLCRSASRATAGGY
jgi:cystathionine beta-lyase/cystathionine gamma-synthase